MIVLYSGTPGSGKSLHVVKDIREYLLNGKIVVSNTYITMREKNKGKILFIANADITVESLSKISQYYEKCVGRRVKEEEILLVIDEAQLLFNSREWQGADRMKWISFFSQHRKLGYHIIIIAQYVEMLDKQIRALIEYDVRHRKVKNIGIWGKIFNFIAGGDLFVCAWVFMGLNMTAQSEWFVGKTKLYKMYDTFMVFDGILEKKKENTT